MTMIFHYLTTALRQFRRQKVTTAISVASLTLGLTCFLLAYGVRAYYAQSDSNFPEAARTYFISQTFHMSDTNTSARLDALPWKAAPLLRTDFPELKYVARAGGSLVTQADTDGRRVPMRVTGADPDFLRIFPLEFRHGGRNDALRRPNTAVLTVNAAERLFGTAAAVGRSVLLHDIAVEVTGVVNVPSQHSHLKERDLQILVPMDVQQRLFASANGDDRAKALRETWQMHGFRTYVVFAPDSSFDARRLNESLSDFVKRHLPPTRVQRTFRAEHISDFTRPRMSAAGESLTYDSLLLALAVIVLGIAGLNYSTLTVAQLGSRSRELGLRRVIGAAGLQILQQHLVEAALVASVAFLFAVGVILLSIPLLKAKIAIDLLPMQAASGSFWIGSLCALLGVIVLTALYPAMAHVRRRPVESLRGSHTAGRPGVLASILVGTQFAAASFLLVALLVVHAQNRELMRAGLDAGTDLVVVLSNNLRASGVSPDTLKAELERQPHVRSVAFSQLPPWSGTYSISCCMVREATGKSFSALNSNVSADYFETLDIELLAGRLFDANMVGDVFERTAPSNRIILDRGTVAALGWSDVQAAVGQEIQAPQDDGSAPRRYEIIGVVEDRHLQATGPSSALRIYWLAAQDREVPYIRIAATDVPAALREIDAVWTALAPSSTIRRQFLDEMFETNFRQLERNAKVVAGLTALSVVIAIAGLIAMALHVTVARRQEIGVRKTLGATVGRIVLMLLRDFSRPIVIANAVAWPLAYLAAQKYLSSFVQPIALNWIPFLASLLMALGVAWVAVLAQSWRAARVQPSTVLRYE